MTAENIGGLAPNDVLTSSGRFKFGSMVRYYYTYMHVVEILVNFNLAVERQTANCVLTVCTCIV